MQRRVFSQEFKLEAVRLVRDRGVAVSQAPRGLDVAESVPLERIADHSIKRVGELATWNLRPDAA